MKTVSCSSIHNSTPSGIAKVILRCFLSSIKSSSFRMLRLPDLPACFLCGGDLRSRLGGHLTGLSARLGLSSVHPRESRNCRIQAFQLFRRSVAFLLQLPNNPG